MKVNQAAIDLIKTFEGFRGEAYRDAVGVWTIGYGTTSAAGVGIVPVPGMTITKAEAEWYLQKTVDKFAAQIAKYITAPINENEFGAFVSLAYNIGPTAFRKSSALRYFNAGDKTRAANNIRLFNKAGGKVLKGLVRRREAERALFLTPVADTKPIAAPGPVAPTGSGLAWLIGTAFLGLSAAFWKWACAVPFLAWVFSSCGN